MDTTTYQEIQGLARMTVGELREKYLDVFGEETRSYHKEFLRKRIAWRIQVLAEGDLTERARRRAEELADDADLRIRTPRDPVKSGSAEVRASTSISHISPSRNPRLPLPGTLLARDFKGRDIVVKVLDNGFEFEGRRSNPCLPSTAWRGSVRADRASTAGFWFQFYPAEPSPRFGCMWGRNPP